MGQAPNVNAGAAAATDEVEFRADEATEEPHAGHTPDGDDAGDERVDESADSDDSDPAN